MEYKVSWAVRTGALHVSQNLPGQDRIRVCREAGTVCVALADGAGSRENSHLGAEWRHERRVPAPLPGI